MRRLLDSAWFYFGMAGVLAVVAIASQLRWEIPPKRVGSLEDIAKIAESDDINLVFLIVDTLRADHLGAYGYERPTSPTIDRLAASGIRFARVEAQSSWTKASMASMWTGLYPQRSGITRYDDGIPDEALMPAEIFSEADFFTAGIFRNSWVASNFGFGQGFDRYVKVTPSITPKRLSKKSHAGSLIKGSDIDLSESAIEFLQANRDERFMLYVHFMDAHQYTYDSESDLFGTRFIDLYDNAIHWVDINIKRILDTLAALGLEGKTVVVLASDHGEGFYEHGFEGHAKGLYSEVQFTPWIISLPFDLPEPIVVDAQVANVDIWPTLLDLFGLDPMPSIDGRSAMPAVMAAARAEPVPEAFRDRAVFSQIDRHWGKVNTPPNPFVSIVRKPYRLQHRVNQPRRNELFDHSVDPDEAKNLVLEEPEVAERLLGEIEDYLENSEPAWEHKEVELNEMRLNQLRALGYKID